MNRKMHPAAAAVVGLSLIFLPRALPAQDPTGPTYDGPETRQRVDALLEAHGWERWNATESVRFELAMYLPELTRMIPGRKYYNAWRRYDVTLEPATSRAYAVIPMAADEGPAAAFDGEAVWGRGYWLDPQIADKPLQLLYMHSSFLRMPFLTQLDGAILSDGGEDRLPGRTELLSVVTMKFEQQGGSDLEFRLFIDPSSNLLVGFEHNAFYPPLPGGVPALAFPRMPEPTTIARIVEQRQTVNGVVLPRAYYSAAENSAGEVRLTGTHFVLDAILDVPFEADMAALPEGTRAQLRVR